MGLDGMLIRGASAGLGGDSGHAASITQAAISDIAGNKKARTGDAETGIQKIFDADKVQKDINAQVQITQTFGREAAKAIASYAASKIKDIKAQQTGEADPEKQKILKAEQQKWEEGGAYRVALHTAAGGLAGGVAGALGSGAASAAAPMLNDLKNHIAQNLEQAGINSSMANAAGQLISGATATGVGALASGGNVAGAATAFNADANNRQLREDHLAKEKTLAKQLTDKSKGKYTAEQIEEQMRGMTVTLHGGDSRTEPGIPDTVIGTQPTDTGGTWAYAGTTTDGKPIIMQQPASADSALRAYIVRNTTGSEIPSLISYTGPYVDTEPTYTNTPGPISKGSCVTAECATGWNYAPLTPEQLAKRKNDMANIANSVSTQAGRFSAAATAYGTYLASHSHPFMQTGAVVQFGLAGTSTIVGFGASVLEQLLRPNIGQTLVEGTVNVVTDAITKEFSLVKPAINEFGNAATQSKTAESVKSTVNFYFNNRKDKK